MRRFFSFNLLLFACLIYYSYSHDDGHHHHHQHLHSHDNEPPHLKYSRELNEAALLEESEDDTMEVHHDHDHHHHHGHSHDHDHGHECGHDHGHSHHHDQQQQPKRVATTLPKITTTAYMDRTFNENGWLFFLNDPQIRLWTYAIGSTLLISAFPCLLLALIPVDSSTNEDSPLLRTLLAFGAGGLLGDAFLHLIPHANPQHSHSHGHVHSHSHESQHEGGHSHEPHDLSVGTWVLVGFMTFFIVEKMVRIVRGEDSAGHGHSHTMIPKPTKKAKVSDDESTGSSEEPSKERKCSEEIVKSGTRIRVAAYLNLVADFMHNFTDGLAIGASFIASPTVGVVTMVTVLVHEVPHEIGDFAILVQSGFTKKRAMLIQLCTAFGALAGCALSLWDVDAAALAEAAEQSWALPFTAGGFIYIGTVSMIPDLLERSTVCKSINEVVAIMFGLFMMYLIALFE